MVREKDTNWTIQKGSLGHYTNEQAQLAVLMDLRDELKTLNRLLHSKNFLDIPHKLDSIRKNTAKKKVKRKPK